MDNREKLIAQKGSKAGLRGKIDAKCIECIYDPDSGSGGWREQVTACTSPLCPLFSVRPVTKKV